MNKAEHQQGQILFDKNHNTTLYPKYNFFCFFNTGGLFDLAESKQEVAFRYAVERVNANRKILSQSLLSAIIEKIPPQDSFHASKRGKTKPHKYTYSILFRPTTHTALTRQENEIR